MPLNSREYTANIPQFALDAQNAGQAQQRDRNQFGYNQKLQAGDQAGQNFRAGLAADASKYGATLQQQRFDTLFPYLTGQIGQAQNNLVGGASGPSPNINVGPVYDQGKINQQVNAARASNDQQLGTTQKGIATQAAARGFGANSPLQMALNNQAQLANMNANTDSARNIRFDTAQANADQLLKGQTARENQFASRQQEDIERRKSNQQYQSNLLSVLASLR